MADAGIKNVVIPATDLPAVTGDNQYIVRYRIVTDDRNRNSHWSPMYSVTSTGVTEIDADAAISGRVISIVWQDASNRPKYDVFVKFDGGQYAYHGTATATNYSLISQGTVSFQFCIQVEGMKKEINNSLKIYESDIITLA